jgi:hypothetical protein
MVGQVAEMLTWDLPHTDQEANHCSMKFCQLVSEEYIHSAGHNITTEHWVVPCPLASLFKLRNPSSPSN